MNSVLIGKIVNVHGIKGELKVYPYTDDIDHLATIKKVYLDPELKDERNITCRIQKGMLLVKMEGIHCVEEAEKLRNHEIYLSKKSLPKLEEDNYYIEDLLGLEVVEVSGKYLGTVNYIFNTGANDVYEILTEEGNMIYLPAIKQVIQKIDLEQKKISVKLMDGLIWQSLLY